MRLARGLHAQLVMPRSPSRLTAFWLVLLWRAVAIAQPTDPVSAIAAHIHARGAAIPPSELGRMLDDLKRGAQQVHNPEQASALTDVAAAVHRDRLDPLLRDPELDRASLRLLLEQCVTGLARDASRRLGLRQATRR